MSSIEPTTGLQRDRRDGWIGGVCAGIARVLGIPANVVRVAAVVLAVIGGFGVIAYLVLWLLIPEEGHRRPLALTLTRDLRRPGAIRSFRVVVGTVLVVGAAIAAIVAATGGSVRVDVLAAAATIAIGVALVVSAPFGGGRLLIPLGLLLATLSGVAAAANLDLRGGVGDRNVRPSAVTDVKPHYRLAAGQLELDLRGVSFTDQQVTTKLDVAMGEVLVRVPKGIAVRIHGSAAAGDVRILGHKASGSDASADAVSPGRPALRLDAHVGLGEVRIVRGNAPLGEDR